MASLVRTAAIVVAGAIALGFSLFAIDELGEGSQNQVRIVSGESREASVAELNRLDPPPAVERERERIHSSAREYIDDANDIVLSPFTGLADFQSVWASRGLPALLGLLLFGLGGLVLANALPKPHHNVRDWRETTG